MSPIPLNQWRTLAITLSALPLVACDPLDIGNGQLESTAGRSAQLPAGAGSTTKHTHTGTSSSDGTPAGTSSTSGGTAGQTTTSHSGGVTGTGFPSSGSIAAFGGTSAAGGTRTGMTSNGGTGGLPSVGGASSLGGISNAGGTSSIGGTSPAGGTSSLGGRTSIGGTSSVGGSSSNCANGTIDIRGRITSTDGHPFAGVEVSLSGYWPGALQLTDGDGRYAFTQLCKGETYVITPQSAALKFCTPFSALPGLNESVDEDFTGSVDGCGKPEWQVRALVVAFDPFVPTSTNGTQSPLRLSAYYKWHDPLLLAQRFARAIKSITQGALEYEITPDDTVWLGKYPVQLDGSKYGTQTYANCIADSTKCFDSDAASTANAAAIDGLCDYANAHDYGELWMLGAPHFGFPALERVGPAGYGDARAQVTQSSCWRVTNIAGFNYGSDLDSMLRAFHERVDSTLNYAVGITTPNRLQQFQNGCGTADLPLNGYPGAVYDSKEPAASYCDDFITAPLNRPIGSSAVSTDCSPWGCTELGYHRYVLSRLPGSMGLASDGSVASFYRYTVSNELLFAAPNSNVTLTCSSSTYAQGWCSNLVDGLHDQCNEHEWATAGQATGWVELAYPTTKTVASVTLYDRVCDEQVMSGHLEFSDGSAPVAFGALENTGAVGTKLEFATKKLSWLRVVIDAGSGKNVGLSEIVVE